MALIIYEDYLKPCLDGFEATLEFLDLDSQVVGYPAVIVDYGLTTPLILTNHRQRRIS